MYCTDATGTANVYPKLRYFQSRTEITTATEKRKLNSFSSEETDESTERGREGRDYSEGGGREETGRWGGVRDGEGEEGERKRSQRRNIANT